MGYTNKLNWIRATVPSQPWRETIGFSRGKSFHTLSSYTNRTSHHCWELKKTFIQCLGETVQHTWLKTWISTGSVKMFQISKASRPGECLEFIQADFLRVSLSLTCCCIPPSHLWQPTKISSKLIMSSLLTDRFSWSGKRKTNHFRFTKLHFCPVDVGLFITVVSVSNKVIYM